MALVQPVLNSMEHGSREVSCVVEGVLCIIIIITECTMGGHHSMHMEINQFYGVSSFLRLWFLGIELRMLSLYNKYFTF